MSQVIGKGVTFSYGLRGLTRIESFSHRGTERTEENCFRQDLHDLQDCSVLNSNPSNPVNPVKK